MSFYICQNSTFANKTTILAKKIWVFSVCLGVFLIGTVGVNGVSALDLGGIFSNLGENLGIVRAQGKEEKEGGRESGAGRLRGGREENIQTIKVFEPDKNIKAIVNENVLTKKLLANSNDAKDLVLDPDKENFYAGESVDQEDENMHSDNAIYKVQKGESIYSIAAYFSISPETILSFNKISEKEIVPGLVLEVPPVDGLYYEVKKGDTLNELVEKYKVDLDDITLFNGLLANENLTVGEEIFIPGAKVEKKEEKKKDSKSKSKNTDKNKNLAKNNSKVQTVIDPVLGNLSRYIKYLGRGSTAQKSKLSDLKKYASLPKYPGYYIMPAPGTSRTQTVHGHNGSDFAGPVGTPVLAAAGGTVRVAKSSGYNFGYGNYIVVSHPNGSETIYAHLSRVFVNAGQTVTQGQNIGAIGSSGNSTGPHLHFEIRGAYNPWAW